MKKIMLILMSCLLVAMAHPAAAQEKRATARTGTLTILLDGFPDNNGDAKIALCNSEATCKSDKTAFRAAELPIREKKASWTVPDLPWGTYAVKVYHDENSNGKLDKNTLGLPKEAYGFSNNARGTFGPPAYQNMIFRLERSQLTIRITLK